MKVIICIILMAVSTAVYTHGDEDAQNKQVGRRISVGASITDISGTNLSVNNIHSSDLDGDWTKHSCAIGYKQRGRTPFFVTLIELPDLENDSYSVTYKKGMLIVTTVKGSSLVMSLNLEKLAPETISDNSAEQDGGGKGE